MKEQHRIVFVGDDALPEGHDFVFVTIGESSVMVYRESALSPSVMEDSATAYYLAVGGPPSFTLRSAS